jgi:hypothetical protein
VNMTNDSKDYRACSHSDLLSGWSEHVFRKKYTDPMKLKESLDEIYGHGKYQVIVCSGYPEIIDLRTLELTYIKEKGGRWIISLPTQLSEVRVIV